MNSAEPADVFQQYYNDVTSPNTTALRNFRLLFPEKTVRAGANEWRYRVLGNASRVLLTIPGGELVNDMGFEFALAISGACRIVYPAWPRVQSIEDLADGLCAILDAENMEQVAILGASFGGSAAQIFVRKYPERVSALILSNTGVPLRHLVPALRFSQFVARALPWSVTTGLLKRPLLRTLDPAGDHRAFWSAYLNELFSIRLTKADVLANFRNQLEYHRRFHFTPKDLEHWKGKVLIAESDTDVIGPRRREALRLTYPNAELRTFHEAGHAPMFTCFDEYLAMVKRFLDL